MTKTRGHLLGMIGFTALVGCWNPPADDSEFFPFESEDQGAPPFGSDTDEASPTLDGATMEPAPLVAYDDVECLTLWEGEVARIDLATGARTRLFQLPASAFDSNGPRPTSLARDGDRLLFCGGESMLVRVDVNAHTVETAQVPCEAVANVGNGLLVLPSLESGEHIGELFFFPSFDAIADGLPPSITPSEFLASRATVAGDTIYLGWHSSDRVQRRTLEGEIVPDLVLGGFDGWLEGMAVVGDQLFVLSADRLFGFSLETGEIERMDSGAGFVGLQGLSCAAPIAASPDGETSDDVGAGELAPPLEWSPFDFATSSSGTECDGDRFVTKRLDYGLYVGAVLCSPTRYKLYASTTLDGPFHQLGDNAGHGQDHCELVNPNFRIPDEDDITSGCDACDEGPSGSQPGITGFVRPFFGEAFELDTSWGDWTPRTTPWLECGVAIPE